MFYGDFIATRCALSKKKLNLSNGIFIFIFELIKKNKFQNLTILFLIA